MGFNTRKNDQATQDLVDRAPALQEASPEDSPSSSAEILKYPLDLEGEEGREVMRFSIVSRDALRDEKKSIYLYTPAGIAISDAASYSTSDFGFLGGLQQSMSSVTPAIRDANASSAAIKNVATGVNIGEIVSGGVLAAKQELNWGVLDVGLITSGRAKNTHTNLQFDGVGMRSFTFAFKMVAESENESNAIRQIENTFRKFLYPTNEGGLGLVLKYPPYWKIQFFKAGKNGLNENPYLPYIDLCYLRNVSVVYNSSSNAFHPTGAPVELDLSLSFDEAQQNTREDLYSKNLDYESAEYHWERGGLEASNPVEG